MANESLRSLAKRLGITTVEVPKKASEFERLMEVRGCSLTLTSVAKSVICLEIAANNSQVPVDKVSFDFKIMNRNSPFGYWLYIITSVLCNKLYVVVPIERFYGEQAINILKKPSCQTLKLHSHE